MGIVQKESFWSTIASYLGIGLGYINKGFLFIILLESFQIGLINLLLATGALMANISNFGVINSIWKFFPVMRNSEKNHRGFLVFNLLIAGLGVIVVTLLIFLFNDSIIGYYSKNSKLFADYFWLVIPVGVGVLLYKVFEVYLRVLYKTVFSIIANDIISRLAVTILLFVYYFEHIDFNELVIFICLAQWIPTILLVIYIQILGEWNINIRRINIPRRMRRMIYNYSGFSYLNSLGVSVVVSMDTLMIAGMLGLDETGVYTTVLFVSRLLTVPYGSILRISAPLVAEYWKNKDLKRMQLLYQRVSSICLIIGLYLFLGVWINRVEIFSLLPKGFEEATYTFLFITIGRLFDMYFGLNGQILVTSKKYRYDAYFTALLLVLVFILNLICIPWMGIQGAAISTSMAYFCYNVLRTLLIWKQYKIHPFRKEQFIIIGIFIIVVSFFELTTIDTGNYILSFVVRSVLCTILFPLVIYLMGLNEYLVSYIDRVLSSLGRNKKQNKSNSL